MRDIQLRYNTVACHRKTLFEVNQKTETISSKVLDWFSVNEMKVADDTSQYIVFCINKPFSEACVQKGNK